MTIKNKTTLKNDSATLFASGKPGGILASQQRTYNIDDIDSQMNLAETTTQQMSGAIDMNGNNLENPGNNLSAEEVLLTAQSVAASQIPAGLDTPMLIEFGPAQLGPTDPIQLSASGLLTINQTGTYNFRQQTQQGRAGSAGTSVLLTAFEVNGVFTQTRFALIENANNFYIQDSFDQFPLNAGDVLGLYIIRDSTGNNSGQLQSLTPSLGSLPFVPSAFLRVSRSIALP